MRIRAVIFDLGGVIIRTEDFTPRTTLAQRLGMSRAELEQIVFGGGERGIRAALGEISDEELWRQVAQALKVPADEIRQVQREFWGGDRLDTALVEFIRGLRPRYRTALLSNAWSGLRRALNEQYHI